MIQLTPSAIQKIQTLQSEGELEGLMQGRGVTTEAPLRVSIRPGGCSGFSYNLYFDFKGIEETDWVGEFDGVKVIVDSESAPYLLGATLDYKESLTSNGFQFQNPNVNRSCGCGQSFS